MKGKLTEERARELLTEIEQEIEEFKEFWKYMEGVSNNDKDILFNETEVSKLFNKAISIINKLRDKTKELEK